MIHRLLIFVPLKYQVPTASSGGATVRWATAV